MCTFPVPLTLGVQAQDRVSQPTVAVPSTCDVVAGCAELADQLGHELYPVLTGPGLSLTDGDPHPRKIGAPRKVAPVHPRPATSAIGRLLAWAARCTTLRATTTSARTRPTASNEAGLLVVHLRRGGGRLTYSPQAWTVIEEPDAAGQYLPAGRFGRE